MNILELHNRLIKRAGMQKVAGPRADAFRKVLNDFKAMRVNPQRKAKLIENRDVLERSKLLDIIHPNQKGELNLLLTPSSDFDMSSVSRILDMTEREANRFFGLKGISKFRERIENSLKRDRFKALEKIWDSNIDSEEFEKLLQDASAKQDARAKILAKKYLGDI